MQPCLLSLNSGLLTCPFFGCAHTGSNEQLLMSGMWLSGPIPFQLLGIVSGQFNPALNSLFVLGFATN